MLSITATGEIETWLTVECCVCGKYLGVKEGHGVSGTSHGYCPDCYAEALAEIEAMERERSEVVYG